MSDIINQLDMKYNKLSNTDIEVSEICLGTMTFGEQNSESEGHQQMDYALDAGVNFFDTAELYAVPSTKENNGKTEEIIGTWLSKTKKREHIILGTKVAGPSDNLKYISKNLGFSRKRILEAVEGSLNRLQTDYIDLYQLHWPERKTNMFGQRGFPNAANDTWGDNFLDVIETMNLLIKEGKIRHWGLSNETPWGTMHVLNEAEKNGLEKPVSIQNPYSLLNRTYETGMAEVSVRENIGLLAYSPLGFGLLSGKYHKGTDDKTSRRNKYKEMNRYDSEECYSATTQYLKIAEDNGLSLTQMALAFINSRDFITSNIIGATNLKQLKENIESSKVVLSKEIIKNINKVQEKIPNPAP
ncbi:MAG: aryl-alcohol dehydrogenase-like predicted oxidoreductase [Saprospiraceae bacterium]|jgi:aryl-alcohol dehydrogenase-like predicted oxidoreductase